VSLPRFSITLGIADPPAENSGMLAVSIKKSSRVARDFSCFPREAIVSWHSACFFAATSRSCYRQVLRSVYWGQKKSISAILITGIIEVNEKINT
jgi:hypothetical protein